MGADSQPIPDVISAPEQFVAPGKKLLSPIWLTVLVICIIVSESYLEAIYLPQMTGAPGKSTPMVWYLFTIGYEGFLLLVVWLGLRSRRVSLREIIGGRWNTPEDFLLDVAIAAGYWIVSALLLAGVSYALGLTEPAQAAEARKVAQMIAPLGWMQTTVWIGVSAVAGFVEEIVFRGYLQRQLGAIIGNIYVGLVLSAIVFGSAHAYEGTRRMVVIALFGCMFGLLALWRKNLRPGMLAHAWQDALAGVLLRFILPK
jgi:uncharacterized protein